MATTCHVQEDDLFSRNLQKRYNGLVTVRTRAIRGKGAWYWFHLEPILFQNQDTGTAKAVKLRCGLCSALFSASNPSRTATEHLKRGTCPNFRHPEAYYNGNITPKFKKRNMLTLPAPLSPLAMIPAPCSAEPVLPCQPTRPELTQAQIETAFDLLAEWFYESCGYISFSTLDHPKFKAFLHHLGLPQVNKRYLFGQKLDAKYEEAKFEFDDKLQDAMFFQLSTDGWKKKKKKNHSADVDAFVNVMLNLPNGSSLFHKVIFLGDGNLGSDYIRDVLGSTIREVSGSDVTRCAGIVADIGDINSQILQELDLHHHWMVNITCQSKALQKLLQDFFKHIPLFASTASLCLKLTQRFKSHHFASLKNCPTHHQNGSLDHIPATIAVVESVAQLSYTLGEIFTEKIISTEPSDREISGAIQDSKFWEELDSVVSLIKIMRTSLQEIEEDRPCLGQCLPLWEEVKTRIKGWCNSFNINEKPVMELVNRRFAKNYHQAWAASYILDPLYLVEDSCGRYLPPFKFLTSKQEKDVVKIITRLTQNEEAHIALMELMKWRTEGLDPVYARAVQAKERDPVTGKMKVVNPLGGRLVWETYLVEFKVLRRVAARLIFLQATTGKLKWNQSFLSWGCTKSRSNNTIERAQKLLFVSSHQRFERGDLSDEQEKDSELFNCENDKILSQSLVGTPVD
ncbi:hypothetical protein HHK36_001360 [Tetracentron sinense]|uniref:DUF7963 domain-containing protein n=1 Tax=Tetracentron sinense TaxID=13715 RepID=A0A834ZT75_TETSI|nr:hypothetical protein HHK36_001360 [Tetracentron sinense]